MIKQGFGSRKRRTQRFRCGMFSSTSPRLRRFTLGRIREATCSAGLASVRVEDRFSEGVMLGLSKNPCDVRGAPRFALVCGGEYALRSPFMAMLGDCDLKGHEVRLLSYAISGRRVIRSEGVFPCAPTVLGSRFFLRQDRCLGAFLLRRLMDQRLNVKAYRVPRNVPFSRGSVLDSDRARLAWSGPLDPTW